MKRFLSSVVLSIISLFVSAQSMDYYQLMIDDCLLKKDYQGLENVLSYISDPIEFSSWANPYEIAIDNNDFAALGILLKHKASLRIFEDNGHYDAYGYAFDKPDIIKYLIKSGAESYWGWDALARQAFRQSDYSVFVLIESQVKPKTKYLYRGNGSPHVLYDYLSSYLGFIDSRYPDLEQKVMYLANKYRYCLNNLIFEYSGAGLGAPREFLDINPLKSLINAKTILDIIIEKIKYESYSETKAMYQRIISQLQKIGAKPFDEISMAIDYGKNDSYLVGIIACDILNIREEPKRDSPIVAKASIGTIVSIYTMSTKLVTIDGRTDYWYFINYNDRFGWVFGGYVDTIQSHGFDFPSDHHDFLNFYYD